MGNCWHWPAQKWKRSWGWWRSPWHGPFQDGLRDSPVMRSIIAHVSSESATSARGVGRGWRWLETTSPGSVWPMCCMSRSRRSKRCSGFYAFRGVHVLEFGVCRASLTCAPRAYAGEGDVLSAKATPCNWAFRLVRRLTSVPRSLWLPSGEGVACFSARFMWQLDCPLLRIAERAMVHHQLRKEV
jgi:hypothetical protein